MPPPRPDAIRVTIQQPALPRYRVPVFRELAAREGIALNLIYGNAPDAPANAAPSGFSGHFVPIRRLKVGGLLWHRPAVTSATKRWSDVLILTWDLHYLSLLPALLWAKINGVRTILWGHGYSKNERSWRSFLRRSVARLADRVVLYNETAARRFVDVWGWDSARVHVALNSLDQTAITAARQQWLADPDRLVAFRREQDIEGRPVLLFVSRLQRENRVDLLLQAAAQLVKRHPSLRVVVIGRGEDLPRLQAMKFQLGIEWNVLFLGSIYDEAELAPWFLSATAFCYPANVGLSLLHAFGYGVPVVTSDRIDAQNPEIQALVHGENGLLYRDGDAGELARALNALIENPQAVAQMGARGLRTVHEQFTLQRMVDGLEGAIRSAAADSTATAAAATVPAVGEPGPPANQTEGPTPATTAVPALSLSPGPEPVDVAIIANAHTPYRVHLHRRIVDEMPEVRLWSVFTHETSNAPWAFAAPPEIRPVLFGQGESSDEQDEPRYALREWRKGGRIIRWLKAHRIKAVVVLGYNDPGRLRVIRWCHRHGVKCLLWGDSNIRGDTATGWRRWAKNRLVPLVIRRCDAVLPCGRLGREYFARYGAKDERMFLFPVEPDYDLIQSLPAERIEQTRAKFNLNPDRRRIVFSGRLVEVKRCDLLIDAFAAIADARPGWDLVIVGDGPLRAALQTRVPTHLRSRVTWTGFFPHQKDVAAVYRSSDVLVLPSDYEPWALVINEAAAAGLAIVCTDVVGAAAELVREGENGWTFKPGDLAGLKRCMTQATDEQRVDALKAASMAVLDDWCRRGDPIDGLRRALCATGAAAEPAHHPAISATIAG